MAVTGGSDERAAVAWHDQVRIGALVEQQPDDVQVAFAGGSDQRTAVAGVPLGVDVRA